MALSEFSLITLLTFLLGGGGSDLLDYIPTDTYWEMKQVAVTPEVLRSTLRATPPAEVEELIAQLSSPDAAVRDAAAAKVRAAGPGAIPALEKETKSEIVEISQRAKALVQEITADTKPASVRRLMAIRTLGERKQAGSLDVLRPLLESEEPFVAEYAARAIAQVEGKPYERKRPDEAMRQDLWLLPSGCAAVAQYAPRGGLAVPLDQAIRPMHIAENQKQERIEILTQQVLELAETAGNMRVDGVTFGLSGDIGDRSGFLVAVLRGQFDRVAFAELIRQQGTPAGNVEGYDLFQPDAESAMFFASDNLAVFMAAPAGTSLPLKEMGTAVKTGKGRLHQAEGLQELIEAHKAEAKGRAAWAVAQTTPEIRQFPAFAGFEKASLVVRQEGQTFHIRLDAEGSDAQKVQASVQELTRMLTGARKWFDTSSPFMPPLKPVAHLLRSVTPKVEGTHLTATATFKGPVTPTLVFLEYPYATAKAVGDDGKVIDPAPAKPAEEPEAEPQDAPEPAGVK